VIGHNRLIITPFANGEVRKRVARFYRGRVVGYPASLHRAKRSHYYSALGRMR
jgi:hypothetical protein